MVPALGRAQVTGTTHKVALTWVAPSPVGGSGAIQGFNLYRLLIPTTTYAKINAALIPATTLTYTDSGVVSGAAYDYQATTVDTANNESAGSTAVQANIPSNPNPPALSAVAQ